MPTTEITNSTIEHLAKVSRTMNAIIELAREENITVAEVCKSLQAMAVRKLKNSLLSKSTKRI